MEKASRPWSAAGSTAGHARPRRVWTSRHALIGLFCIVIGAAAPQPAWGQASSGGYSRPAAGHSFSYSAPSRRAPIVGGGYSRRSYSDQAISRSASSQALRDYQAAQRPAETYTRRPPIGGERDWGGWAERRPPVSGGGLPGGTYGRRASPGSGMLTAMALWAALNAATSPGRADYFYDHRHDPQYLQWRQEADRQAARDPALAEKLGRLDTRLAQMERQPRSSATRPAPAANGSGFGWLLVAIGIVLLILLWLWRRRTVHPTAAASPPGLAGTAATRFRVGMTLPIDPAPFLLAEGLTKITPPEGTGMISVEAVGVLRDGEVLLHRLYLPGSKTFFQLHLGPDGRPDDCRYFSLLDEVAPANSQDWGFWLDPAQGMIGWPSFETKDGKLYGRVWAPSDSRIPPRRIDETRQYLDRGEQRQMQAMLYGGPTGGTPLAPDTEYILVSAVEATGQAWIEIHAGIDVNPAALSLPSVALAA